jgi:flagellar basal body-associated protein FliL
MAITILILVVVLMIYFANNGKKYRMEKRSAKSRAQNKQRITDDEIVTVILPTINNDGK